MQAQKPPSLFPAAASAISIYSPAASPPGHSAAAAAGFQGCSVIKHPCLLQLLHFASLGMIGAGVSAEGMLETSTRHSGHSEGPLLSNGRRVSGCWEWSLAHVASAHLVSKSFRYWKDPLLYC